jgi:hypothetical protein
MEALVGTGLVPWLRMLPVRAAVFLAVMPAAALFVFHASRYGGWLIDDAGISFAYARNLASGYGLVSQPGQVPVEGFSNPLWVLLIAVCYALKLFSIPLVPKLLSVLAVLASFAVLAAVVLEVAAGWEAPVIVGMGLLLTAANPGFVVWCISGLENPLLVLLASLLLLTTFRALRAPAGDLRLPQFAGALAAGLALTRPDAVLYCAFFPIALLVCKARGRLIELTCPLAAYGLAGGVPFGAWLLFRRLYFQDWLPNTYYAKGGVSFDVLSDLLQFDGPGFVRAVDLSRAIFPLAPVLIPLLFVTPVFLWRRIDRRIGLLAIFASLAFLAYIVLPNDWMGEYRFGTLAFSGTYLLGFVVLAQIPLAGRGLKSRPAVVVIAGVVALAGCVQPFVERERSVLDSSVAPLESVARSAWKYNELARGLGLKHPVLLLPDLGGTLLLSNSRVVDVAGLCDRFIARMYKTDAQPAQFAQYILDTVQPDLVHVQLYWSWKSGIHSPQFAAQYIDLGDDDYVRRSSLPPGMDEVTARAIKEHLPPPPSGEALRAALSASRTPVLGQSAF